MFEISFELRRLFDNTFAGGMPAVPGLDCEKETSAVKAMTTKTDEDSLVLFMFVHLSQSRVIQE
jgi:hypothetical protein